MKKSITNFMILFISLTFNSYAQELEFIPSLADEGLVDIALQFPEDFTNPELMLLGTVKFNYIHETLGEIPIALDVETGKSNVWFYMFRSGDDHENVKAWAYAKASYAGNEASQNFPIEDDILELLTGNLPFTPEDIIPDDFEWINSDVMVAAVIEHETYINFMTAHEDADVILTALAKTDDANIDTDNPVWGVIAANDSDTLFLYIDAETGVVIDPGSSVYENSDEAQYKIRVYPNPITTTASILIPEEILSSGAELKLFDSFGREVSDFKYSKVSTNTSLTINNVANGTYFLNYIYGDITQIVPIIINK
ncbi:MAG: T9SS type A sorting domain-containing protein [Candidatus Kapabacteria bacterium]|jgi:hypothetical protein|nr:T9SS type A sorting domain-containing protein [Candidatus Kapabacteria bacterium]